MINTEITTTKGMEQAQRQMEQAKNRMAMEKKKANEERRRSENAHKYMMDGVVHKYFPECYCFEESEMNEILKVAIATPQCQKVGITQLIAGCGVVFIGIKIVPLLENLFN